MPVTRKRKQVNQAQSQGSQPARTHVEFSSITQYQALHRQWSRCAHCGKHLSLQLGHAHHVIPAQTRNTGHVDDAFLRSVDNCVILCKHCHHEIGHSPNYGENAITSPGMFRYSYGLEKTAHRQWADKLSAESQKYGTIDRGNVTMLH